jgi:hypothetical protein
MKMNFVLSLLVLTALFVGSICNHKLVLKQLNSSATISEVEISNDVAENVVTIPAQEDWEFVISSDLYSVDIVTSYSFIEMNGASNPTLNMLYLGHSPPCLT